MTVPTDELLKLRGQGLTHPQIAKRVGMTPAAVKERLKYYREKGIVTPPPRLSASPFQRYENPLSIEGDALVLNDLEVPFHHSDFVNRCLDLADAWGIKQLILGGDVMHFETLSAWGAAWQQEKPLVDTISEKTESEMREFGKLLPPEKQPAYFDRLAQLASNRECTDDEIKQGAKVLKTLASLFDGIYYVLGNHDDRFLRKLQAPLTPDTLLAFLGLTDCKWHIKPYFYAALASGGEKWRIEHQRSTAPACAVRLADKFECHILAAHNHTQAVNWSTSGRYWAISTGCAADEGRMAYASQRSTNRPAHKLGAVIIRQGYPFILNDRVPWDVLRRC